MSEESSEHFRFFAQKLKEAIARYGVGDCDPTKLQRQQVEQLAKLETKFRLALLKHRGAEAVYTAFVRYVRDERRNILAARPFFRERQDVFTKYISPALDSRDWQRLTKWHINYHFVVFASKQVSFKKGSEVAKIKKEIDQVREQLMVLNLPLAISRSNIFYSRTSRSHLSFMDFVQLAADGLMAGIDKYFGKYREVWRSVAISRMTSNFIDSYSAPMLHFYPSDKKKLYRAAKFLARRVHNGYELGDLVDAVNHDAKGRLAPAHQRTNEQEISDLVAAASTVSADTKAPGDADVPTSIAGYEAPADTRPDVRLEQAELRSQLRAGIGQLSLFEKKLLRLGGLDITLA